MNISNHSNLQKYFRLPGRLVAAMIYMLVLPGIFSACTDELQRDQTNNGKGETVTLRLSLSVPPMLETKAVVCEAGSGSEARKAGFYYEMQVSTTGTAPTDSMPVATKAATSLKNVYAFLFKSDGTFNGRASLPAASVNDELSLEFTDLSDASAANGRLVIIANDNAAATSYTSSTVFASFTGTYTDFQNLTLASGVTSDADIPYVGSAPISLSAGSSVPVVKLKLYRMLAKIVLTNDEFSITGGPARSSINLYNAGKKYFGTPNDYEGTGSTVTISGRLQTIPTAGENANSNTWYVGENVQTAAADAFYIELKTAVGEVEPNTTPLIGEEYISGDCTFKYKVYINNYALRRNTVYNITVKVSGTLEKHLELANTANSNVSVTDFHGGLNIGMFGGASGYSTGTGSSATPTITGSYTKYLLIQPNTSETMETDIVTKIWSNNNVELQTGARKYWDHTYTSAHIDDAPDLAYNYCYNLTIGGVAKGTWYLPTQVQLMAIWGILGAIKGNSSYAYYSSFHAPSDYEVGRYYWSSTEDGQNVAQWLHFGNGRSYYESKTQSYFVRCVRDL